VPAVAAVAGLPNKLGKYELLMPLAAGGMARIYIGRSTGIGSFERHVVLKLITPERANDATAVQMFLDEARLAASLNHQNVAQVFEVGEDLGIHYLAMEYVHGQDLRALLAKAGSQGTRIPLDLALTVVAGAASGLNHAHERRAADGTPLGIVHRDVSPSNIMIGYDGSVKLLDFGIAKATARSVQTQSGIIKGKFAYMAPEQCRGRDVDRRSDVFSLGIILYEITTQHRCFRADSDFDTMHRIVTGDVVRPTRLVQGYPPALEAIVMKALAVDAVQRYQSAAMLLEALESFSIASRYSLSTMGLGRFMRDMFGEISEPWLGNWTNPVAAKESTVSSTDGRSEVGPSPLKHDVPELETRFPDSGGIAAKTTLDLPKPEAHADDDSEDAEPLTQVARPTPLPQRAMSAKQSAVIPVIAQGSQPIPMTGPQIPAFQTPGSGSGPSHVAAAVMPGPIVATTRHGYASGGAMTAPGGPAAPTDYPRYEGTGDEVDSVELRPNRTIMIAAVGVLVIGIVIIIAMVASGSSKSKDNDGIVTGSADVGSGSAVAAGSAEGEQPPPPPPVVKFVQIHVSSNPKGADVLIAGTKVGTTPYVGKLEQGTASVALVVRMNGYVDFTSKIDLSTDEYTNDRINLAKPVVVTKPDVPETNGSAEPPTEEPHHPIKQTALPKQPKKDPPKKDPPPPVKQKCQPQGQVNPFDTTPVCK
jgi:eukaryotic-like serine/threonine-protein kinase